MEQQKFLGRYLYTVLWLNHVIKAFKTTKAESTQCISRTFDGFKLQSHFV